MIVVLLALLCAGIVAQDDDSPSTTEFEGCCESINSNGTVCQNIKIETACSEHVRCTWNDECGAQMPKIDCANIGVEDICNSHGVRCEWKADATCGKRVPHAGASVITFNTGLYVFVPFVSERFEWMLQNIDDVNVLPDSDIICINEVFEDIFLTPIRQVLSSRYPYSYSTLDDMTFPDDQIACQDDLVEAAIACLINEGTTCVVLPLDDLTACIQRECPVLPSGERLWSAIRDTGCGNCMLRQQIAGFGLLESIQACNSISAHGFENTFGLLLMSKTPITNTKNIQFMNDLNPKGALKGDVDGRQVICTHLATYPQWTADGTEFVEDTSIIQIPQVDDAMSLLDEGNSEVIFAGDLNTSPDIPGSNFVPVIQATYEYITDVLGLVEKYTAMTNEPTWDFGDNKIIQLQGCTGCGMDLVLDHVFVRQTADSCISHTERILVGDKVETGVPGYELVPLSDHYGVLTVINGTCT